MMYNGEGNGNPIQYSCLGNPMDRGAWWAIVHGVARVRHDLATEHACMPAEYMMRTTGQMKKLESRLLGKVSVTSDMQIMPPLWQKVKN